MLADYGNDYLGVGVHTVKVKEYSFYTANYRGIEFTFRNAEGTTKMSFSLSPKSLWKLANFAKACGFTKEEMEAYDEARDECAKAFLEREVQICVDKVKGYCKGVDFYPIGVTVDFVPKIAAPENYRPVDFVSNPVTDGTEKDDDLPF